MADLAQELAFGTVVAVEVLGRSVTAGAVRIGRDPAFAAPAEVPAFPDIDSKTDTERRLYESQDFYGAQFSPDEARAFLANQTGMNDFSVPRGL